MSQMLRTTLRLDLDKPASANAVALLRQLHAERGLSYSVLIVPAVNAYYGKPTVDEGLRETIRSIVREELMLFGAHTHYNSISSFVSCDTFGTRTHHRAPTPQSRKPCRQKHGFLSLSRVQGGSACRVCRGQRPCPKSRGGALWPTALCWIPQEDRKCHSG